MIWRDERFSGRTRQTVRPADGADYGGRSCRFCGATRDAGAAMSGQAAQMITCKVTGLAECLSCSVRYGCCAAED